MKKALLLSEEEQQKVMSRMSGKLPKRLFKDKLSVEEAIAIQLEIEEEQLAEWRKNWAKIRKQDGEKKSGMESKSVAKSAAPAPIKSKATAPASKLATAATTKASTGATGTKAAGKSQPTRKPAIAGAASSKAGSKS